MKKRRITINFSQKDYQDLARGIQDYFALIIPVKAMERLINTLKDEDMILLADIASHSNLSKLDSIPP